MEINEPDAPGEIWRACRRCEAAPRAAAVSVGVIGAPREIGR